MNKAKLGVGSIAVLIVNKHVIKIEEMEANYTHIL
jgi:hypothetical protein